MAKLAINVAALLIILAVAAPSNATTYRTTVTTTTIEEADVNEDCWTKVWGRPYRQCMEYLSSVSSGQGEPAMGINMVVSEGKEEEYLRGCCEELKNTETECLCDAVYRALRAQMPTGHRGFDSPKYVSMSRHARYLTGKCELRPKECPSIGPPHP